MPSSRWVHVLSLELGWMTPGQARRYVDAAQQAGILVPEGEEVALSVDPASVQVQRGFRPNPDALPEAAAPAPEGEDPFSRWLQKVAAAMSKDAGMVLADVADVQERFGGRLGALPALLLLAGAAGLDVRGAAAEELDRLTAS